MNTRQPTPTTTRILAQRRNFKPRLTPEILRQQLQLMLLTPATNRRRNPLSSLSFPLLRLAESENIKPDPVTPLILPATITAHILN